MIQFLSEHTALAGNPGPYLSIHDKDSQLLVTTFLGTYTHPQT